MVSVNSELKMHYIFKYEVIINTTCVYLVLNYLIVFLKILTYALK